MSAVLARLNEMGLELPARRSAGQYVVVDGASSLLLSLFGDTRADACPRAGSSMGVAELAFDITAEVEMVAEVTGP